MNAGDRSEPSLLRTLPSAAFLACSWTWCVGMWLPVYLINDFGAAAWFAFAVPNVVGAATVGFLHRPRDAVDRFTRRGLEAMRWFSVVTILFHLGFLAWMTSEYLPAGFPEWAAYAAAPAALALGAASSGMGTRAWGLLAIAALPAAPVLMLAVLFTTSGQGLAPPPAEGTVTDPAALPLYAVGLAFGFLLCPHLDLSILRVRRETPGAAGDAAFVLGFAGFFLIMIAFTALYAGGLLLGWFSHYLLLHFFVQGTFTVGAHLRELRAHGWPRRLPAPRPAFFLLLAGACVGFAPLAASVGTLLDKPATRVFYETFIWFYALPFPAAAWFLLRGRRLSAPFWWSLALATPAMGAGALLGAWWAIPVGAALPIAASQITPKHP